ncbi:MAG: hypothetical protein M0P52_06365 [Rhodoferax sp.]|nr:hypothetical protein [Rhodoferax sp.]
MLPKLRKPTDTDTDNPWLSDGMWFLTQHKRWGLMAGDPDYLAVAKKVNRLDVYATDRKFNHMRPSIAPQNSPQSA